MSAAKSGSIEILLFRAASRRCGVPSLLVQQVVRAVTLTPTSKSRHDILGLLNLRGQAIPVFDLRQLLTSKTGPLQPDEHLVVLQADGQSLALRADQAEGLSHVRASEIQSPGSDWVGCTAIEGIVNVGEELVLLLDPLKLWDTVTALQEPSQAGP